jgi:mRNA interferase MazF
MPSTTTFERGQVVVVHVPFTGQAGSKPRPAVVISTAAFHRGLRDVIICPISSRPNYYATPGPGDQPLARWREIGLQHPSTARVSNLVAVEKSLIKRVIATMPAEDFERIEAELRFALGL